MQGDKILAKNVHADGAIVFFDLAVSEVKKRFMFVDEYGTVIELKRAYLDQFRMSAMAYCVGAAASAVDL